MSESQLLNAAIHLVIVWLHLMSVALGNGWDMTPDPPRADAHWSMTAEPIEVSRPVVTVPDEPLAVADAAHTPMAEVVRVLDLLPKPQVAFVDFGCGYDARWCVAAAEKWGCKVIGIEIDPRRAAAARERVRNLGLDHLITIIEGDAATVPVAGDVAVAYLYPELLARMKPRLEYFSAVASYLHEPAGLPVVKNGDSWIYRKQAVAPKPQLNRLANWGGQLYSQPVCTSRNCAMCNSIRGQLAGR